MISVLTGTTLETEDDGCIVIDVVGVGYKICVNDRDRDGINRRGVGADMEIFIREIQTETSTTLFGFVNRDDRRAFDRLLEVEGVGPLTGIKILSALEAPALKAIIDSKDVAKLKSIHGVGPKIADRLVEQLDLEPRAGAVAPAPKPTKPKRTKAA